MCVIKGGLDSLDLCELASKEVEFILLAALEKSQLSKLFCCYHIDGWDSYFQMNIHYLNCVRHQRWFG